MTKTAVLCDTHALIYWSLAPKRLGSRAAKSIERARKQGEVLCADISLWEISMLVEKERLILDVTVDAYLNSLIAALGLNVLPISPSIATLAQSGHFPQRDPADRLIGATAMVLEVPLITRDKAFSRIEGLQLIWS